MNRSKERFGFSPTGMFGDWDQALTNNNEGLADEYQTLLQEERQLNASDKTILGVIHEIFFQESLPAFMIKC
jgi:hypothetical protein